MSLSAAALRLMAEKGLSALDIAEIAEALEVDAPISSGAERQRRWRERQKALRNDGGVTRDVMGDVTENNVTPPLSPPSPNPPHTPQEPQPPLTPPHETAPTRKGRATRLAEDWQPAPLPLELAGIVAAWQPGMIERELSKFRDWAASAPGERGRKVDWDAAWRNWLRKADEQHGKHRRDSRRDSFEDDGPRNPMVRAIIAGQAERSGQLG